MIKPPGDPGRGGVLEVHDHIFITVKVILIKQRSSAMDQTGELKIHILEDALAVKTGKQSRGCSSVKTFAVVKHPDSHSAHFPSSTLFKSEATRDATQSWTLSSKPPHPFSRRPLTLQIICRWRTGLR